MITGATGFIGSRLTTEILARKPKSLRVVSSGSSPERLQSQLTSLDLKVYKTATDYVRQIVTYRPDYLFILGGNSDPRLSLEKPRLDLEYNLLYNFDLLEKLAHAKAKTKIIYVSSIAVYGDCGAPLNEKFSVPLPKSPYGINKLAVEGYIRFFAQSKGLPACSVRLSPTYGPGLKKQVVYDFVKKLLTDPNKLLILGDGTEVRDLSFIDDQVAGLLLITAKANYEGEIYNLGSGKGISVTELAKKISQIMRLEPKIIFQRTKHEQHHGQTWVLDIAKVLGLGHRPKISLDEGLAKTIDWIKAQ